MLCALLLLHSSLAGPHGEHAELRLGEGQLRSPGPAALPPDSSGPDVTVYGYHPYWGDDPTQLPFERLSHVAIFNVDLNSDGTLADTDHWTDVAGDVVPLAHSYGTKVHVCMTSFNDSTTNSVLGSASRRAVAVEELQALVDDYDADGVNVDIEGLDYAYKSQMVSFVQELKNAVPEVYLATPSIDWAGAWDYSELSDISDGMFIMGYGYHWGGGDPGPVDPLFGGDPWSTYSLEWTVDDYLTYGADPEKIIVGLPLYGYEWPANHSVPGSATGTGSAVFMASAIAEAESTGPLYDEVTHSPYALPSGSQLWYPDNDSVQERIAWTVGEGLGGVGFWALGYEGDDPDFWQMVGDETGSTDSDPGGTDTGEVDTGEPDSGGGGGGGGEAPVALAGSPFLAYPGDLVALDGTGSYDPDDDPITYAWTQVAGPEVALDDASAGQPRFNVNEPGTHSFQLVVSDGTLESDPDIVDVVVVDPASGEDAAGCCSTGRRGPASLLLAGLLGLFAQRRRR